MTNKFNIHWQVLRVRMKQMLPRDRIKAAITFLHENPYHANYKRVLNWTKMTSYAYRQEFDDFELWLRKHEALFSQEGDLDNDMEIYSEEELQGVLHDLEKRKYNFQYAGVPKQHMEFVDMVNKELGRRKQGSGGL